MTAVEPRENAQASAQASAQAARQLRARISNGQLPPGAKLSEQAVARELGVSRNTLREAFTMLAAERLVDRIAHRGVFVAQPDADDVRDLYAARGVLEPGTMLWGAPDPQSLSRLSALTTSALAARNAGDVPAMADANQGFHRELVASSGSAELVAVMDRLSARMRLVFHAMSTDPQFHARYAVRNTQVLRSLESGDRDRAVHLLRESLTAARDEILAHLT